MRHGTRGISKTKCRLRPWLQAKIDSEEIPGLCWLNKEHTKFKIPWKHGGKQDWSPESGRIFMASIMTRSSFRKYNVCADIRAGFPGQGRQTTVGFLVIFLFCPNLTRGLNPRGPDGTR